MSQLDDVFSGRNRDGGLDVIGDVDRRRFPVERRVPRWIVVDADDEERRRGCLDVETQPIFRLFKDGDFVCGSTRDWF
jgi:hypothetical protein